MLRFLENLTFSQPYLYGLIPLITLILLTSGCATADADTSSRTRNFATTAVTTTSGAYIGAKEGGGQAKNAAVGAALGFVAGEAINHFGNKAQREAYLAGYEKGQSNAVKQQYWIARGNQRPSPDDGYEEAYFEIPVPATEQNGVRREPTTRVIRIVVPKEVGS